MQPKKGKLRVLALLVGTSIASSAYAIPVISPTIDWVHQQTVWIENQHMTPVVTLSVGGAFSDTVGNNASFPIVDPTTDSFYIYQANRMNQTRAIFGGFLGVEFLLCQEWSMQFGFGYYQPESLNVSGNVTQGADLPSADIFTYHYSISPHQMLAEAKFLYNMRRFHPYAMLGLGASLNDSQSYAVNITPPFITFSNQFANHTEAAFSYALGFGVDMDIDRYVRLGVGYRFRDFGESKTGHGVIDTTVTSNRLKEDNLHTNEVLAQLTWVL
jgi:opacity protein-like surface antigen